MSKVRMHRVPRIARHAALTVGMLICACDDATTKPAAPTSDDVLAGARNMVDSSQIVITSIGNNERPHVFTPIPPLVYVNGQHLRDGRLIDALVVGSRKADVASLQILNGAEAVARYGSAAAGRSVIDIALKPGRRLR